MLGLHCHEGFSLGVLSGGHFLAAMRWPLVAVAHEGFSLGALSGGHFLAVMRWPLVAVASLTVELRL